MKKLLLVSAIMCAPVAMVVTLTDGRVFKGGDQLSIIARIKTGKGFIVRQLYRQCQLGWLVIFFITVNHVWLPTS